MRLRDSRRLFLSTALGSAGLTIIGCRRDRAEDEKKASQEPEVTATEDLMREHGVLRRILIVFSETGPKLRHDPSSVALPAVQNAAKLFRAFGEEYHEKQLEEAYIF